MWSERITVDCTQVTETYAQLDFVASQYRQTVAAHFFISVLSTDGNPDQSRFGQPKFLEHLIDGIFLVECPPWLGGVIEHDAEELEYHAKTLQFNDLHVV